MAFEEITTFRAKELIGKFPHEQMTTYICSQAINIRLGPDKLKILAQEMVGRDIQQGEAFFFINKSQNHYKIIYRDDGGICLIEKKNTAGKFKIPPVESMKLNELIGYLNGDAVLH